MNKEKIDTVRKLYMQIQLSACSSEELIKMFWILTSHGLKDEANIVADYVYLKNNPALVKVTASNLPTSPPPLHNLPRWLTGFLPRFLWHQRP